MHKVFSFLGTKLDNADIEDQSVKTEAKELLGMIRRTAKKQVKDKNFGLKSVNELGESLTQEAAKRVSKVISKNRQNIRKRLGGLKKGVNGVKPADLTKVVKSLQRA